MGKDLFGLRPINRAVSLFAHPEKKSELLKVLTALGLSDSYKSGDWQVVHKNILDAYLKTLKKFSEELSAK